MVCRDFNFVECALNKTSYRSQLISNLKRNLWNKVKQTFDIEETFLRRSKLQCLWDNGEERGQRILARLDKVYVFNNTLGVSQKQSYCTKSNEIIGSWTIYL